MSNPQPQHCGICGSDEQNAENPIITTSCHHYYHYDCLLTWFMENDRKRECPYCRSLYSVVSNVESNSSGEIIPGFNEEISGPNYNSDWMDNYSDVSLDANNKCIWIPDSTKIYDMENPHYEVLLEQMEHPGYCFRIGITCLSKMCVKHFRKTVLNCYNSLVNKDLQKKLEECRTAFSQCHGINKNGKRCSNHPVIQSGEMRLCRKHLLNSPDMSSEKFAELTQMTSKCKNLGVGCAGRPRPTVASGSLQLCSAHFRKHLKDDIKEQYTHWRSMQFKRISDYYDLYKPHKCKGFDKDGNPCKKKSSPIYSGFCSLKHMNPDMVSSYPKKPKCSLFNAYTGEYCNNVSHGNMTLCLVHLNEKIDSEEANTPPPPPKSYPNNLMCCVYDAETDTYCDHACHAGEYYCLKHIQQYQAEDAANAAADAAEAAEISAEDAAIAAEADGIEYKMELLCSVYDARNCMVSGCANERYKKKLYCTHHIEQFNAEDDDAYGPDY